MIKNIIEKSTYKHIKLFVKSFCCRSLILVIIKAILLLLTIEVIKSRTHKSSNDNIQHTSDIMSTIV